MSHLLEEYPSSFRIHALAPQDLTGRITKFDDQYCAAGSFGDVYRCQYHSECGVKEVAVKAFRFEFTVAEEDTGNGRSARMIRRELGIWKRLSHPNIVPFLGTVFGFGRLGNASLVSSWMPNGTLQDFLLKYDDKLTVAHRLQLLLGIANGLQYLHPLSIVHGDLTCNNVLLDEKYNARLADFGYASLIGDIPEALAYLQASTLRPGTVRLAAPEYFSSNPEEVFHYTTKSDIYSFGNVALQVLSGKLPWSEFRREAVIMLHLARGHKPRRPQSHPIDDQHWEFIEDCWSPVEGRPSAERLVISILVFLRSYPHSQPFCTMLLSSENSNPQSTLSGPLLLPPNTEQFSPNVPFENDLLPHDQPQLIPESNSSTLHLQQKHFAHIIPEDDGGNEAFPQPDRFQSTLETLTQNGSGGNPNVSIADTKMPKRPPAVHSKSGAASALPLFLNTSIIYPSLEQHSIDHQISQRTTAFGRGNRGPVSESHDRSGGFWSSLLRRPSLYPLTVTSERTAGASHRRRKQDANFVCPVPGCGSTFTRSFNLKGHMRSHNEEHPFQCKWPGCGKGFARQHNCKRHERLHYNYRPILCGWFSDFEPSPVTHSIPSIPQSMPPTLNPSYSNAELNDAWMPYFLGGGTTWGASLGGDTALSTQNQYQIPHALLCGWSRDYETPVDPPSIPSIPQSMPPTLNPSYSNVELNATWVLYALGGGADTCGTPPDGDAALLASPGFHGGAFADYDFPSNARADPQPSIALTDNVMPSVQSTALPCSEPVDVTNRQTRNFERRWLANGAPSEVPVMVNGLLCDWSSDFEPSSVLPGIPNIPHSMPPTFTPSYSNVSFTIV